MSHAIVVAEPAIPLTVRSGPTRLRGRTALRVGAVGLILAEVVWMTSRVDGIVVLERIPGLSGVVRAALAAWQSFAVALATMALLSISGRRVAVAEADVRAGSGWIWAGLAAHMASFTAFAIATDALFGPQSGPADTPGVVSWGLLGLATLASGLSVGWPVSGWASSARRNSGRWAFAALVGLAASGFGRLTLDLWRPLNRATFWLAGGILRLIASEVVCRPDEWVLGTPAFPITIEPGCSGYEGIGLILALTGAYLIAFRRDLRMPRALLLLPIGVVTIWVANAVRLVGLISVGTWVSSEVAIDGFHSQAGWIAFNTVGLGLIAASRAVPWFRSGRAGLPDVGASPTVAYLAPMVAVTATAMITGAFTSGFDRFYPARVLAAGLVLWACRRRYRDLRATWSWVAVAIGGAVAAAWVALETWSGARGGATAVPTGLAALPPDIATTWFLARLVGYVAVAPLVEELAFRGYLSRRVGSPDFTHVPMGRSGPWGVVVSSALFGLLHDRVVAGTLAGLAYAYASRRRGELTDAVVAHATTNALLATLVLTTGDWSYWG